MSETNRSEELITPDWDQIAPIVDRFEAAWASPTLPILEDFLPEGECERRFVLLELVSIDLELRLKRGEPTRVEHYLQRHPSLTEKVEVVLDLLEIEWRFRRRRGENLTIDEFCTRFPYLSTYLHERLSNMSDREEQTARWKSQAAPPNEQTGDWSETLSPVEAAGEAKGTPDVPGYEILGELGHGGMGVVYHARQILAQRLVALKMIRSGELARPQELIRFHLEAEAVARLQHPNVVQIHEVGEYRGQPFFSLELCEGGSLADRIKAGPLAIEEAAQTVETIARAVHEAHRRGIVHRDLKPANVLLTRDGTLKVADFGIAKHVEGTQHTQSGAMLGTPTHIPPELAAGQVHEVGPWTDIYALGVILCECLTGSAPFRGSLQDVLSSHLHTPAPRLHRVNSEVRVPRDLETIYLKCLEKEQSKRYTSAHDLAEDVRRWQKSEPIQASRPGVGKRFILWAKRRPALAVIVLLLILLTTLGGLAGGAVWLWRSAEQARDSAEEARKGEAAARKQLKIANEDLARILYLRQVNLAFAAARNGDYPRANQLLDDQKACPPQYRQWEWNYVKRLASQNFRSISSHRHEITAIQYNPDLDLLATADRAGDIQVRHLRSEKLLYQWQTGHRVTCLRFSRDNKILAAASADAKIRIWNLASGKLLLELDRHTKVVNAIELDYHGRYLISGSDDQKIFIWYFKSWSEVDHVETINPPQPRKVPKNDRNVDNGGHRAAITSLALHPRNKRNEFPVLVSADKNGKGAVWRLTSGKLLGALPTNVGAFSRVRYNPNETVLAAAGSIKDVKLYPAKNVGIDPSVVLHGHTGGVLDLAFSADGKFLATASLDNTVRVWDLKTQKTLLTLQHPEGVTAVDFVSSETLVTNNGREIRLWDITQGAAYRSLKQIGSKSNNWISYSPDGRYLAVVSDEKVKRGKIHLWDAQNQQSIRRLTDAFQGHQGRIFQVCFSPDSKLLASASVDQTACLWDVQNGKLLCTLKGHQGPVTTTAFSPDGTRVVTGSEDTTMRIWDVATGKLIRKLTIGKKVFQATYSPNGNLVAVASADRNLKLYDASSWRQVRAFPGHQQGSFTVAFSPDGSRLVGGSRDHTIHVWDVKRGNSIVRLQGHGYPVTCVAFSPDGERIVSGSADSTVRLWATDSGLLTLALPKLKSHWTQCVGFSPDGSKIVCASQEPTIRIWDALPTATKR